MTAVRVGASEGAGQLTAKRVLIVYRTDLTWDGDGDGVQDSLEVAQYYAAKRGVPAANLLGLAFHDHDQIGYGDHRLVVQDLLVPIRAKIAALGAGSIDVLLLSLGLPFEDNRNAIDNALMALDCDRLVPFLERNPYFEAAPGFGHDHGHFSHARYRFISALTRATSALYLVCRLDGPRGVRGALDLIDQALYADRFAGTAAGQLGGNVYVDSQDRKGPATDESLAADPDVRSGSCHSYEAADVNIARGARWAALSGLPVKWESTVGTIGGAGLAYRDGGDASSAPRAAAYGGWYNLNHYQDVFGWLPGAVACDLNSSSLYSWSIRDPSGGQAWAAHALAAGATYVCGAIDEPYASGHPRPDVLLRYLLAGYPFAEAAALATPTVGWKAMAIGDPLGAPFAAKRVVADSRPPRLARAPIASGDPAVGAAVEALIDDSIEPEVAQVRVDYGPTTAYGASFASGSGFFRHHRLVFPPLAGPTHYRLTMTDAAGNAGVSGDFVLGGTGDGEGTAAPAR